MLTSIHIRGFKGFRDTKIPELRRVNLILGGQNSGKTSLLEAIYAGPETIKPSYGTMTIRVDAAAFRKQPEQRTKKWVKNINAATLEIQLEPSEDFRKTCFSVYPITDSELVRLYDVAVRKEKEDQLTNLLQLIEPRLKNLRPLTPEGEDEKIKVVHANLGLGELVPLSQLGQGFNRLAYLYAGLLGQNANIALIDEIENGIHYSALPILWQGIANMARELDIQIFATTHSYECIQAAAKVFEKTPEEFQLIRLDRTDDNNIAPVLIQGRKIQTALQSGWEVR